MQVRLAYNSVRWRFRSFSPTPLPTLLCFLLRAAPGRTFPLQEKKHVNVIGTLISAMYDIWPHTKRRIAGLALSSQ